MLRPLGPSATLLRRLPALLAAALAAACIDDAVEPDSVRFGLVGEVRVQLVTPLAGGVGQLRQLLVWSSTGSWQLFESISYRGLVGDEHREQSQGDQAAYASFISNVNESQGASLFVDELDPDLEPSCASDLALLSVTIRDDLRRDERAWRRCARGPLEFLDQREAGPDPAASRVVQAALWVRDFTAGSREPYRSRYQGSLPFGTLDRGGDSGTVLEDPAAILPLAGADSGEAEPPEWRQFWEAHAGAGEAPPFVDWDGEMVILGFDGVRSERGDSVEVRRVLSVTDGTVVEMSIRVPGDFCAPASGSQVPFHIVVAPRSAPPVRFPDLRVERVPCIGG